MKFFNRKFALIASFCSIPMINLFFYQPAIAAISCEAGTIYRHANGSLSFCLLARNTKVTIRNNRIGTSIFPCKAKNYISFAENSQFQSCILSKKIKIREKNSVRTCLKDYKVSVSTSSDNKRLFIQCYPD